MMVTFFKSLFDKKATYTKYENVLASIKQGPKQLDLIQQIRKSHDEKEKEELKKQLGVVCFGGKFTERKAAALVESSRLVILDFDHVNVPVKRQELLLLPYIHAVWISPSGDGLKALVKTSSDNYIGHYKALVKEIKGVDTSGKDICRACFISYDPSLYLNPHSDIYTKVLETVYNDEQKLEKLKTWLENKGEHFVSGNRNNFLAKLAGACNRFGIDRGFVESAFATSYVASDFSFREMQGVVNSIYTSYAANFNTQSFDEVISESKTKEILSSVLVTNDAIYLNDVAKDLLNDYENGTPGGGTTYFPSIDSIYRPLPGDLNVLSGISNSGKSAISKQLDMVAAVMEGRKCAAFSPEEQPPLYYYRELIRTYIGKPVEKEARDRMTLAEFRHGMEFVREHFIFIYPPELPTPEYVLERFAEVIIKHNVKSVTLDPWNQLLHIMAKRDDIYLGETLSKFERFAQNQNVFFTTVCHPNRTEKGADGNYKCPSAWDLNGGPVWSSRATNICMYHRPFFQTDPSDPTCEFHSKKIKRQLISGLPGMVTLDYNRKVGRFYDGGFNPLTNVKT